jgi:hypothetical protein
VDTLKDWLQDALKDLNIDTFNEEGIKKVVLQSNDSSWQRTIMPQGMCSRRKKILLMGNQVASIAIAGPNSLSSLSSTKANCASLALRLVIPSSSCIGPLERLMIKQEML